VLERQVEGLRNCSRILRFYCDRDRRIAEKHNLRLGPTRYVHVYASSALGRFNGIWLYLKCRPIWSKQLGPPQPDRGTHPKELIAFGIREYREIFFKPYRIIYRVMNKNVYILLIADGRRDMQTALQRRLIHAY
jgi:hypothetical protein